MKSAFGLLPFAFCTLLPAAASLKDIRLLTPDPARYGRIEFAIQPLRAPVNPFDPTRDSMDALVVTPSGKKMTVPGFWFQDYRRSVQNPEAQGVDRIEVVEPVGQPEWRVRFA